MRAGRASWRLAAAFCLAAAAWAGWLALSHLEAQASLIDPVEAVLADARLRLAGQRTPPDDVVIVAIDDATVAAVGGYPLPRDRLAEIVAAAFAAGAATVAVDILLVDPGRPAADDALAAALAQGPAVIAAAARFGSGEAAPNTFPAVAEELWPAPPFEEVAAVGIVNVATDSGGVPRHLPLLFLTSRGPAAGFVLRAAALYLGEGPAFGASGLMLGARKVRLDEAAHLPLRYYGPGGRLPRISAETLLAGNGEDLEGLQGRLALVGVTATAVGDTFGTPFDPVMPGVEVLGTGIAHLVAGDGLVRDVAVRRIDAAAAVTLAVAGVALVSLLPLATGALVATVLLLGWLAGGAILFADGIWLAAALPVAAFVPPVAAAAFVRQQRDRRAAVRAAGAARRLGRFHPPSLANRIATDPGFLAAPVERHAGVVFVDLSGFTAASERIGAAATRELLKDFHGAVEDVVAAGGGLVLNFMGDGALASFGVPDVRPDAADAALAAGFALVPRVRQALAAHAPGIDLRVGVHFGPTIVSRLGHEAHQQITVSGDSVNVASRLLEVAKAEGAHVVATGDLEAALSGPVPRVPDERRTLSLRGRAAPLDLALWRLPAAEGG